MAGAMWRRLVDGVCSVATDTLLANTSTSICLIVYSDDAQEVWLPSSTAELRELLLSREYAPRGGTSFKAAFELTQRVIGREVQRFVDSDIKNTDIDIATLVFTDGEDTSVKGRAGQYGVRLVDKEASSRAARNAGDAFRKALQQTGCSTYVCIAAFGADHDPDQCQYLSDRYYFINRGEVLSEVLAGGLGSLLTSAGQCRLCIELPVGVTLAEAVPETIPLDASGRLEHHIWLHSEAQDGVLNIGVEAADVMVLKGSVMIGSECVASHGSFDHHLFLVDFIGFQLRVIARELCGRHPSADELTRLRERLTAAKDILQPTRELASLATGQLRGRAALRERVAEVEALRERLSYALGQFDERDTNDDRKIGTTAIDAILRDAGQHVPQGAVAAALILRADILAELPTPERLSTYGSEFTLDYISHCDACELASQGDAMFFQLTNVKPAQHGFISASDSSSFISFEAFALLSRNGKQAIKGVDADEGFKHLGFPLYATEGHFLRARLLLPDVLQRLSPCGSYEPLSSERQLLSLLGRSLATSPRKSEMELIALLHKARSVYALLSSTEGVDEEEPLLGKVIGEAKRFVEDPASRADAADLFSIAAAGMFASEHTTWLADLGDAVVSECLRRRIEVALRTAGDSKRLCLAWSLLGPEGGDDSWIDRDSPFPDAGELGEDVFNPFTAPAELEALEEASPGKVAPRPNGVASLLAILSAKRSDNLPRPGEWSALRHQLNAWGETVAQVGGIANLWTLLDDMMIKSDATLMPKLDKLVGVLRTPSAGKSLRGAFRDVASVTRIATTACLGEEQPGACLRHIVATGMRELVEKRRNLAFKYPIIGASFPCLEEHSGETVREVWGAPANPVDAALHHKASLRVWRRTMNCRITMTTKEALTDKEYRKRGGKFAFPSPLDTFIRGLHRRTEDLHRDWRTRMNKKTSGDEAHEEAVEEMLLRLRWDDSDSRARAKLKQIVGRIWDDLEGVDLTARPPLSSALWLDDDCDAVPKLPDLKLPDASNVSAPATPKPEVSSARDESAQVSTPPTASATTVSASPETTETRIARDGGSYSLAQFIEHYGEDRGSEMWQEAKTGDRATCSSVPLADDEAGSWELRATAAQRKMDRGLQTAFDEISPEIRRSMDQFSVNQRAGAKLKLSSNLSAKQRKAVHLWAEMNRCEHLSFGYRGRRRLWLSVGVVPQEDDSPAGLDVADDVWYDDEGCDDDSD
jgi:hypothetical protein